MICGDLWIIYLILWLDNNLFKTINEPWLNAKSADVSGESRLPVIKAKPEVVENAIVWM